MSRSEVITQTAVKGDCVKELQKLTAGSVHLGIMDPPYNIGMPYDSYADNKSYTEYMRWAGEWFKAMVRALHKHGSLWVFVPDEWVSEVDIMARHEFKLYKRRHIVWAFTFGVACQGNFSRSHCHILYLTKAKTIRTFNDKPLRHASARTLEYNDKRANPDGKLPDATWMILRDQLLPYMLPTQDVWLESRICGTFKERKKHSPNQIPLPIMERIILACSNPGDLVVDAFVGTGGSGVVATQHGRNFIGYDISSECVKQSNNRIKGSQAAMAKAAPSKKKRKGK